MRDIDIGELRTLLKFEGVVLDDFTDDELELLVKSKIRELEGLIGFNITPTDRTQVTKGFRGTVYDLNFYPVINLYKVYVDDIPLPIDEFNFNSRLGVIYFEKPLYKSNLRILYTTGVNDKDYYNLIVPLLKDMVAYTVGYGKANQTLNGLGGFVNSMHEGDTSLSLGSKSSSGGVGDYGYNSGINTKIDDLRKRYMFTGRVKYF